MSVGLIQSSHRPNSGMARCGKGVRVTRASVDLGETGHGAASGKGFRGLGYELGKSLKRMSQRRTCRMRSVCRRSEAFCPVVEGPG